MKNFIPLVLAVLLGLAAVLAVGRLLAARKQAAEKTVTVVAAARDVVEGEIINEASVMKKEIPVSALPAQAIFWSRAEMVTGQKALRSIAQSDYILLPDVGLSRSMANIVGEGEWAVSLNLAGKGGVARLVQPGDEVAVIGTFKIKSKKVSADQSAAVQDVTKEATLVLFPRVRVLDVSGVVGQEGASDIVLALPPQQATMLVSAQRVGDLSLALRRPNDESNVNRLDAGMIDDSAFDALLDGLQPVKIAPVPGAPAKAKELP